MKAIILEQAGPAELMTIREVEQPTPADNEVLIKVRAISVNPVDYKLRSMEPVINMLYGDKRPVIVGWDIAGVVVAAGKEATKFKVGDAVFGMVNFPGQGDAYAEFVAAPEDQLALKPDTVSYEEAAATTLAALTALQVLQPRVKAGDRVLIHAGSGGVGHFAIQIAKHLGAYVITTASAKNRDFVLSMGADEHIDYRTQAFEEVVADLDFVLDGMSGEVLLNSIKTVKPGGAIISLPNGDFSDEVKAAASAGNVDVAFLLVQSNGKDMEVLAEYLSSKTIKAHVSATFAFTEMDKAHLQLESGRTVGKVVVRV